MLLIYIQFTSHQDVTKNSVYRRTQLSHPFDFHLHAFYQTHREKNRNVIPRLFSYFRSRAMFQTHSCDNRYLIFGNIKHYAVNRAKSCASQLSRRGSGETETRRRDLPSRRLMWIATGSAYRDSRRGIANCSLATRLLRCGENGALPAHQNIICLVLIFFPEESHQILTNSFIFLFLNCKIIIQNWGIS